MVVVRVGLSVFFETLLSGLGALLPTDATATSHTRLPSLPTAKQVMQNKSQNKRSVYRRRCAKVSVAELREAMGAPLNAHSATASLARAAPTGGRCARPASSPHYQTISLKNNVRRT